MPSLAAMIEGLQCPRCGREDTYVIREIDHTERVGHNTVTVTVTAGVCTNCGETALDDAAVQEIMDAVDKLRDGHTDQLVHAGEAYEAR